MEEEEEDLEEEEEEEEDDSSDDSSDTEPGEHPSETIPGSGSSNYVAATSEVSEKPKKSE